jgi:type I restriction-modification system DNA methylase subunit
MEFDKPYNRKEFMQFLRTKFLPEDFVETDERVNFSTKTNYATQATKLGSCESLDLVVYEVRHNSHNDARVGLSRDAFRMLAEEYESRALVLFVPEDSNNNYRFSYVEISLDQDDNSARVTRTYSNPRRFSYYLGKGIAYYTPNKYLNEAGRVVSEEDLRGRFSVDVLTKAFYQELSDWYAWAINIIKFPNDINDPHDNDKYNHESAIRLITRLIFVWFLKQRNLIPWQFFDERYIASYLISGFNPNAQADLFGKSTESKYYKAILQNLFFAMLNSPLTAEGSKIVNQRHFRKLNENKSASRSDFDNNKLMRYERYFINPDHFVDLANSTVPFLNGGLFDCLDDKANGFYLDAFSDNEKVGAQLIIPDYLFFGEEVGKNIDLSEWYGDAKKKKVSARGIIDILKRYNFTVEENTPFDQDVSLDPELLGKVFENLLAAYNPETQQSARKETGSFYTPREIVQFMIDESLIAHLKRTVGDELEDVYRRLVKYTDDDLKLSDEQRRKIMQSLYDCKILDPACGSGAFPVGMLQQMVHILRRIDPQNEMWEKLIMENTLGDLKKSLQLSDIERDEIQRDINHSFDESINNPDYARKLYLIENCIYGVDIQPIAIQISKLRFFISLVVDQKINTNPADNFGIRPLPNLEAKFVAANSLIGLKKKDENLFDLDDIKRKESELKYAKHRIFGAKTYRTKTKWKERVASLREEIASMLKASGYIGNKQAAELASWDMFNQNAASPFFDSEWMFGITDGFDIVIGNPPYVQLQAQEGELAKLYQDCGYSVFARTGDIYCLFYEQGIKLLKPKGLLCYITSNKWMRAAYGEKIRGFLSQKSNPLLLVDFGGIQIFESATVDTNVILIQKEYNKEQTTSIIINKENKSSLKNLSDFVQQYSCKISFNTSDSWVILSPIEISIKNKIEAIGTPLKDWNISINFGVKTGCNEAFLINGDERQNLLDNCKDEAERQRTEAIIRPILRGKDIKRYSYSWSDKWIINTHNGIKGKLARIDIEQYPSIKFHLEKYWSIISSRSDKGDTPYNLRNCAYLDDFNKPKMLWKRVGSIIRFAYDEDRHIGLDSTCICVGENIEYLICVLNSPLGHYLLRNAPKTGTGDLLISVQAVAPIRIVKTEDNVWFKNKLLSLISGDEHIEDEINTRIFDIHKLTEEEVSYICKLECFK